MNLPAKEIIEILKPAYNPCEFFGACTEANWDPKKGHIPRGYLGATGELSEVEVVIVLAEPSHPLEKYPEQSDPISYISACVSLAYECYAFNTYQGKPLKVSVGHTNLIYVLDRLFPDHSFDEQLRKVWITESRLCSIDKKIGEINDDHRIICSNNYLQKQLQILSHAEVIGFGGKAQRMLNKIKVNHHKASALYPPEGNKPRAKKNWKEIIKEININKTSKGTTNQPTDAQHISTKKLVKRTSKELITKEKKVKKQMMIENFTDLEKNLDGTTLKVSDFQKNNLNQEELKVITNSAKPIALKNILNSHTLRDISHVRGEPQTVITEYAKAIGFSFPETNKQSYLSTTKGIMNSFYDQHHRDQKIILMNRDLGIHYCMPSILSISGYIMVVWVADFTLEGIGKLYIELRKITKDYNF